MMKYGVFAEVAKEKIKDFLPERYQNLEVELVSIDKVNRTLDGLTFRDRSKELNVSPNIYLEGAYERYRKTEDLNAVLSQLAVTAAEALDSAREYSGRDFRENMTDDRIYYQLVNTEQNREFLNDKPSREYMDMSIIYRYMIGNDMAGVSSVIITDELAKEKGLTEERMFELAQKNTKELFPIKVSSLMDVLAAMMKEQGMPDEVAEAMVVSAEAETPMYVVSNDMGIAGSSAILYDNALQPLAEKFGSDLYILPSSIHEVLAVPVSAGIEPEELSEMVQQVNGSEVPLEDRLSNNVYLYDKDARELSMATDVPERRLDDFEPEMSHSL